MIMSVKGAAKSSNLMAQQFYSPACHIVCSSLVKQNTLCADCPTSQLQSLLMSRPMLVAPLMSVGGMPRRRQRESFPSQQEWYNIMK